MKTYLGIDGGGSTTRALLVDAGGNQRHKAESGPSNLNTCDPETVRNSLSDVVAGCIAATGSPPSATCFGLAGAGTPTAREQLNPILESLKLPESLLVSDAEIALEGAFSGHAGILLIAGTGSVCLGRSKEGAIIQCGGWGWLADDSGSAGWLGQRALEAALKQNDGRLEGQGLKDAVFTHLGINHSNQISPKLYHPLLSRSKIAELSRCVIELAATDDLARRILDAALEQLESLVRASVERLQDRSLPIAFSGGLILHNSDFRQALEAKLSDFEITSPQASPLEGAIALARNAAGSKTSKK